jgi:hypothetical protein
LGPPRFEDHALKLFQLAAPAFLCLVSVAASADQTPAISPFATARPVIAKHGMVVTQEAAASRVGLDILKRGGNAVDAAVAVGFALAVSLPRAGALGGGGFMLIHRADLSQTIAIDYRETAPAATTKDVFLDANGEADPFKSRYSGLAIGVPGTVAGLELAWHKYGSGKFSFADLIAPAMLRLDAGAATSMCGAIGPRMAAASLRSRRRAINVAASAWPRKTFWATSSCGARLSSWLTRPMPSDSAWRGLPIAVRPKSAMTTSPASGAITPKRIFISVDLPAPFSPSRACTSPAKMSKLTEVKASTPAKDLLIWRSRTTAAEVPAGDTSKGSSRRLVARLSRVKAVSS